ncbi:hypothetical protein [Burkholderia savannae]|uniref:hypothetical protein n=1 Tax=Burkholderia savannae TaxID=1637837 RepID=UPI0018DC6503|nr:hypothetical protein [Burkholderia savannae]
MSASIEDGNRSSPNEAARFVASGAPTMLPGIRIMGVRVEAADSGRGPQSYERGGAPHARGAKGARGKRSVVWRSGAARVVAIPEIPEIPVIAACAARGWPWGGASGAAGASPPSA